MRLLILALPFAALSLATLPACAVQAPQSTPTSTPSAPFVVPMDPGTIACAQLQNPAALAEATEWVMGKARAATLAGAATGVPDAQSVASALASYCGANANSTVRAAAAQMGL